MYRCRHCLAAVAALALLASCAAGAGWTRPNTSKATIDNDVSECTMQADAMVMSTAAADSSRLAGSGQLGGGGGALGAASAPATSLGVQAPGAKPLRFGAQQNAFTNCMTARQYTRGSS